jgi:tetratricopeptide (TPR) repeat protein
MTGTAVKQITHRWRSAALVVTGIGLLGQYAACTASKPKPDANAAMQLLEAKQYQQAVDILTPLISAYPDSLRWLRLRGFAYDELLRYGAGIADYTAVLSRQPDDVPTLNNRGYAYYQSGELAAALLDYSRALALHPAYVPARSNRALVFVALARYPQALVDIDRALYEGATENSSLYNLQGYCLLQLKHPLAAIHAFDQAISLDEGYADAVSNRIAAYQILARMEE